MDPCLLPWDHSRFLSLLSEQSFGTLLPEIRHELDERRNIVVMGEVYNAAITGSHVPLLYMVVRNDFKGHCNVLQQFAHTHLCTPMELRNRLSTMVFTLLRCAQDVLACQMVFGDVPESDVFAMLHSKFLCWMGGARDGWPSLQDVVDTLRGQLRHNRTFHDALPPPVWGCYTQWSNAFTRAITFGNVPAEKVRASEHMKPSMRRIREHVTHVFLEYVAGINWDGFANLHKDTKDLLRDAYATLNSAARAEKRRELESPSGEKHPAAAARFGAVPEYMSSSSPQPEG